MLWLLIAHSCDFRLLWLGIDWISKIGLWVGNNEISTEQHESGLLFYFISLF